VVCAVPAHCTDEIDLGFEGAERLKTIASIPHPPVAVLALGFRREEVSHPLDGFGSWCPRWSGRTCSASSSPSTVFRGEQGPRGAHGIRGGVRNPDLANADLNTLIARVHDDLRALLGARGEPTFRATQLWPKAIPQYTLSHGRYKEIMDEAERRNPGLALAGSYRDGVALGDVIAAAEQAAARVLVHLGEGESGAPA
jgi:oxygen-dependent protoporphyrinogen oxidase